MDLSIRYGTLSCCSYHTVYCIGFDAEVAPDRRVVSMSYHLGSWRHALSWSTYACSSSSSLKLSQRGTWSPALPHRLARRGTWSFAPPRSAGLGRLSRLVDLLGGGLGRMGRSYGVSQAFFGCPILECPTAAPSLYATAQCCIEAFA